jgi:hypothetical protein
MNPNFSPFPLKTESSFDSGPQIFVRNSTPIRNANRFPSMAVATVIALFLTNPAHANTEEDIGVQPPKISVILANNQQVADGLLFVAPKVGGISGGTSPGPVGPEIVDNKGRPVWFLPIANGQSAADFRVQKYHNRPDYALDKGFWSVRPRRGNSMQKMLLF